MQLLSRWQQIANYRAVLWVLPFLLCIGWYVYEQMPTWSRITPAWLTPTNPDAVLGTCEAVTSLALYNAAFIQQATAISADDANAIAQRIIAQHVDDAQAVAVGEPLLLRGTFPDHVQRTAWLVVLPLAERTERHLGKAAVAYLDAETGDPLVVTLSANVDNPLTACGGGVVSRRALARQYLPLLLAGGYIVALLGGIAGWRILRHRAAH